MSTPVARGCAEPLNAPARIRGQANDIRHRAGEVLAFSVSGPAVFLFQPYRVARDGASRRDSMVFPVCRARPAELDEEAVEILTITMRLLSLSVTGCGVTGVPPAALIFANTASMSPTLRRNIEAPIPWMSHGFACAPPG